MSTELPPARRRWLPRFSVRTLFVIVSLVAIGCAVFVNWEYIPGTVYIDQNGFRHGTGWLYNHYPNGNLMVKEYYRAGELIEQVWYQPDGAVFAISKFHRDGLNVGYSLRQDGSLAAIYQYKYDPSERMYVAQGITIRFKPDGTVDKIETEPAN